MYRTVTPRSSAVCAFVYIAVFDNPTADGLAEFTASADGFCCLGIILLLRIPRLSYASPLSGSQARDVNACSLLPTGTQVPEGYFRAFTEIRRATERSTDG
jgi:hypothetical protein